MRLGSLAQLEIALQAVGVQGLLNVVQLHLVALGELLVLFLALFLAEPRCSQRQQRRPAVTFDCGQRPRADGRQAVSDGRSCRRPSSGHTACMGSALAAELIVHALHLADRAPRRSCCRGSRRSCWRQPSRRRRSRTHGRSRPASCVADALLGCRRVSSATVSNSETSLTNSSSFSGTTVSLTSWTLTLKTTGLTGKLLGRDSSAGNVMSMSFSSPALMPASLLLKAGDEGVGTELQLVVLALAARKASLAVHKALEVDHGGVPLLCRDGRPWSMRKQRSGPCGPARPRPRTSLTVDLGLLDLEILIFAKLSNGIQIRHDRQRDGAVVSDVHLGNARAARRDGCPASGRHPCRYPGTYPRQRPQRRHACHRQPR